jgi:hypothetical protein
MRHYLTETSLVFAVLAAIAGLWVLWQDALQGGLFLAIGFVLFTFSYMVKRY